MIRIHEEKDRKELFEKIHIDCSKCFGFCCVALYFSKVDGFPTDKEAGKPCSNLNLDFSCQVHKDLRKNGLKGCTGYDCFGAGQKVAQETYKGQDWRKSPEMAKQMFEAFLVMRQLYEMMGYLLEALSLIPAQDLHDEIKTVLKETEALAELEEDELLKVDIEKHRDKVNKVLKLSSERVKEYVKGKEKNNRQNKKSFMPGQFFLGANLTKTDLIGAELMGALLIAANLKDTDLTGANLIGADLRDADIRGADLSESLFLTQSQVNVAKGNSKTKLPITLVRPSYWEK